MNSTPKTLLTLFAATALSLGLVATAHADDVATPVAAPSTAPADVVAPATAAPANAIPAGTEVLVKTIDLLTSTTAKTGDHFPIEVSHDVLIDNQVVIPAGTRGSGTVVFARKKGNMGKSGALDVRIDYLDMPGGRLKLKAGDNRRGTNRNGAAMGVSIAFGALFALAVHGDDISLPAGSEVLAAVSAMPMAAAQPTPVAAAAPVTSETATASPADASAPTASSPSTTEAHH